MTELKLAPMKKQDSDGRTLWKVIDDFDIRIHARWKEKVPKGFVSNLGTVPRWARIWISASECPEPFVVHDWLCGEDFIDDGEDQKKRCSRWLADAALYEMCVRYPLPFWKCWVIWFATRLYARAKGLK